MKAQTRASSVVFSGLPMARLRDEGSHGVILKNKD